MVFYSVDKAVQELNEGKFYSSGERFTTVDSSTGSAGFLLVNNNDYNLYIPGIVVRSDFAGRIEKGFNPTVNTEGTDIEVVNKSTSGTNAVEGVSIYTIGDEGTGEVTADGSNFNDKHLPAGKATAPGAEADIGGNIIEPGTSLFVRVVNESSNQGIVSIDVDFIKMDNM